MELTQIPSSIRAWLQARGISDAIIDSRKLSWDGKRIVIPIFDKDGNVLFNKYRRDPEDNFSDAPKYLYDRGACAALYGIDQTFGSPVHLCEGELDALRMMSGGYTALSTTGGSGTFLPEWVEMLKDKEVVICYDNDEAGVKGALKVHQQLPNARIVVIPREEDVKDVTDYLKKHSWADFGVLVYNAKHYHFPTEPLPPYEKKALSKVVLDLRMTLEAIALDLRKANRENWPDYDILEQLRRLLLARYDHFQHLLKTFDRHGVTDGSRVQQARSVPITRYIEFSKQGFARCLWHEEKTASMKYNGEKAAKPNSVKCFGCGFSGDVIDVVMKLKGCTFKEAVDQLV